MSRHVIIGTAGHIDHGKSALVEALTGTHPDRLEEEKRRGITIDLGFAFLRESDLTLGFVDVPGHERFVRNMLAGAGGIDVVLLVVAADESIKPQTREHFDICRLLGIRAGIVALTKADLVDADAREIAKLEIEDFVRSSFLEGAPILPVSAKTGAGIAELRQELFRMAANLPGRDSSRLVRMPVDRSFVIQGFGTVVTGTLLSGVLRPEQEAELYPIGRRVRIRGLHSGGHKVAEASAGQRTAANLADIEAGEIERGMVLGPPGIFQPTKRIYARISLLDSARPVKKRWRAHFHQGAAERIANVMLLEQEALQPGASALAQLTLDDHVLVLPNDRFILRQFSPVITIGGGVILDALPHRHRADSASLRFAKTVESGRPEEILAAAVEEDARSADAAKLIARTGWPVKEIQKHAEEAERAGRIRILSETPLLLFSHAGLHELEARMERELAEFHNKNPLSPGIALQELRGKSARRIHAGVFRAALDELSVGKKISISGDLVRLAGREIALSPAEEQTKKQIAEVFEKAFLQAPALDEILPKLPVDAARARKLLQMLLREKTLVRVSEELVFHRTAIEHVGQLLASYKGKNGGKLSVAGFKELAGISRKYAIPLLEYLDRERLTRRVGDERVIL